MTSAPPDANIKRAYLKRLKLPRRRFSESHRRALDRAHELRKFEIENYWRRSTYFWGFQFVAFGALALSRNDGDFEPSMALAISLLGALAAWTAILSAKGSKFWQENWEMHVDFLENEVEGKLHQTALVKKSISYSVSKVNERFLWLLFAGWLGIFLVSAAFLWPWKVEPPANDRVAAIQTGAMCVSLVLGLGWLTIGTKSELKNRAFRRSDLTLWSSWQGTLHLLRFRKSRADATIENPTTGKDADQAGILREK